MRTLRDSWFMMRSDFRGGKLRMLGIFGFTVIFMGYLAILTSFFADDVLANHELAIRVDFLLLPIIPLLGFSFSRRNTKYWSEDTYTRTLTYLRTLPVPTTVILCRRKIQAVCSFAINGLLFFGIVYAISENFRTELTLPSYFAFALTWIGFGLIVSGIYIFIEYLFSGKAYLGFTLLVVLVSWMISLLVMLGGGNVFLYSISCSKEWGLLSPIMWGALLLGTISIQLFSKWTIHRLKSRDLV
jgi:hypothetical protein